MESNIPTPVNVPPSQRPQSDAQGTPVANTTPRSATSNIMRTMRSDAAEAVKTQNETLVSMALAEEKKNIAQREELAAKAAPEVSTVTPAPKPIGRIVIVLGLILFVGGAGVAIKFALPTLRTINLPSISLPTFGNSGANQPKETTPATKTTPSVSLIRAQSEKRFIINKETPERLFSMVATEHAAGVTPGNIRNLYFVEETTAPEGGASASAISANKLLLLAEAAAPAILTRSLEKPFMVGLYGEEGSQATPFFVFKVSGYDTGLAGMLEWENELPRFFDTVFGTKFLTGTPVSIKLHNTMVSGYDARITEGLPAGSIVYTFVNPTTVLIAGSRSALEALVPLIPTR